MGSGLATGFISSLTQGVQKQFDQKHQEEQEKKKNERGLYEKVAFDTSGGYTQEQKQYALQQLGKMSGPETKKGLAKFGDIFGKLHGAQQQAQPDQAQPAQRGALPTPQTAAPQQPAPTGTDPATGRPSLKADNGATPGGAAEGSPQPDRLPTPKTAAPDPQQRAVKPSTPAPSGIAGFPLESDEDRLKRSQAPAQAERDRREKAADKAELKGRDKVEFIETGRLPAQGVQGTRRAEQWELPDGTKVDVDYDPKSGARYDTKGESFDVPEGAKRVASPKGSGQLRQLRHSVSLADAKQRHKDGQIFRDVDGKEIDLEKLPIGNILEAMETGDGKIIYTPGSPTEKTFTVGNRVYARTDYNAHLTGTDDPNAPVDLGQARTGSANTPTVVQRDDAGVPYVLGSTTIPNTPGALPSRQGAKPPAQSPQGPNLPAPSQQAQPSPHGQSALPVPKTGGGARTAGGVTPGMDKDFLNTARSVQQALTQVVGDDDNPNLKTVVSLAPDILRDKAKTERVGKAIRMMLGGDSGLEGAHVSSGVSVGPVSVGVGGFGEFLKQSLNMDAKVAEKINQNLRDAMKDMTPEEKNLVDATIASFEESIAMRSINKSGVSNAQVGAIQNTLPLVGANTFSLDEFATRMQNWAQQGLNGTWGVPPQYFRPGFRNRLKGVSDQMEKLRQGGSKLPTPGGSGPASPKPSKPGTKLSSDDAMKYLQANGGDRAKAEAAAKKDGWTF